VHLNYLLLRSLYKFYPDYHDIYQLARDALITTVFQSWQATGAFWEAYSPEDGMGIGTKAFTWTSLIVMIMTETYH